MEQTKKYKLIKSETKIVNSKTLYRIQALRDFGNVKKGEKGGWVVSGDNLSQYGNCWVYDDAMLFGDVWVIDNAWVSDRAVVCGGAMVRGDAVVCDHANVSGAVVCNDAVVCGYAKVRGDAVVSGRAVVCDEAVCSKTPQFISGLKWGITITDNHIQVGCMTFEIATFSKIRYTKEIKNECSEKEFKFYKSLILNLLEGK